MTCSALADELTGVRFDEEFRAANLLPAADWGRHVR